MSHYFDASVPIVEKAAMDSESDDSDLKWLQIVRGERKGVARMGLNGCYIGK